MFILYLINTSMSILRFPSKIFEPESFRGMKVTQRFKKSLRSEQNNKSSGTSFFHFATRVISTHYERVRRGIL
jgi:hypothetical protein